MRQLQAINKAFTGGKASETKEEGYSYHLGGGHKLKKASFLFKQKKNLYCLPKARVKVRVILNFVKFALQSDKECKSKVNI